MAKKKDEFEEAVIEVEEVVEPIEEPKEKVVVEKKNDYTELFIERQLKAINEMSDRAKAKRLAERILRNRKGK